MMPGASGVSGCNSFQYTLVELAALGEVSGAMNIILFLACWGPISVLPELSSGEHNIEMPSFLSRSLPARLMGREEDAGMNGQ